MPNVFLAPNFFLTETLMFPFNLLKVHLDEIRVKSNAVYYNIQAKIVIH